jgi:hypothetical protein
LHHPRLHSRGATLGIRRVREGDQNETSSTPPIPNQLPRPRENEILCYQAKVSARMLTGRISKAMSLFFLTVIKRQQNFSAPEVVLESVIAGPGLRTALESFSVIIA